MAAAWPPGLAGPGSAFRMVAILASAALLGKMLGFARELLLARIFGASLIADGFRSSVTAVTLPLIPLAGETVPSILIPMHHSWQKEGDAPEKIAALCVSLTLISAVIMLVIEASGAWWIRLLVGGMNPEGQRIALDFTRLMAVAIPASVLLDCLSAAEIATGRSRINGLRPITLNICTMAGILLYATTGVLSFLPLLFAVSFHALAGFSAWTLCEDGSLNFAGLRPGLVLAASTEFARGLRPLLAQPLAEQGQIWLERLIASGLAVGTLASMDYARTLTDSGILLVSLPIGMAVLYKGSSLNPKTSALAIAGPLLAISLPASVYLAAFAPDIVPLVFARGAFDQTAIELTSGALSGIAAGLWANSLGMVLLRFLNSTGRNRQAALIYVSAFAANTSINVLVWQTVPPSGNGSLLLGLGEAVRGFVLLLGVAIALKCHLEIARVSARCALPTAFSAALCFVILEYCPDPLLRLALGAGACLAPAIVAGHFLYTDRARLYGTLHRRFIKLRTTG